jgi:hypothetical protein
MQLEYQEIIIVECEEKNKTETVGRLAKHDIDNMNIVKRTTRVRNIKTGEDYIYVNP